MYLNSNGDCRGVCGSLTESDSQAETKRETLPDESEVEYLLAVDRHREGQSRNIGADSRCTHLVIQLEIYDCCRWVEHRDLEEIHGRVLHQCRVRACC